MWRTRFCGRGSGPRRDRRRGYPTSSQNDVFTRKMFLPGIAERAEQIAATDSIGRPSARVTVGVLSSAH